jgi:hypothetical protein
MGSGGRLAVALGAAGAMLALSACGVIEEHRFEQSAVVPEAVQQVRLEGGSGSVSIDTGSGSTTSIEQTIQYRGDRPKVATTGSRPAPWCWTPTVAGTARPTTESPWPRGRGQRPGRFG